MPTCGFCGKQYELPRGLSVVSSVDGRVTYLCSSKCRKNLNLGRDKKKVKWILKGVESKKIAADKKHANHPK